MSPRRAQRGKATTKTRNISRKDAKAAKVGKRFVKLSIFRFRNLAYFAPWRESIPVFELFQINAKFARAAQTLNHNSTKTTKFRKKMCVILRVLSRSFVVQILIRCVFSICLLKRSLRQFIPPFSQHPLTQFFTRSRHWRK